jgi:hypothetical protein
MIKKQQKWIALFVVCTFAWLMHISAMPVAAAGTAEQAGVSASEQGPDYYEAVAQKAAPAKKGSILPYVLIGVGALAVTAVVLFLFVLNKYDITGSWEVTYNVDSYTDTYVFVGDKKSGTYTTLFELAKGTYAVDGKNITLTWTGWTGGFHIAVFTWTLIGTFSSKTTASGTYSGTGAFGAFNGTWTAVKL